MAEARSDGADAPAPGERQPTDEEALAAHLCGDQTMMAELVRRYERPLYAFLCRMTGRPAEAADLFQETFLRAVEHADHFAGRSRFKTWLYSIAVNLCRAQGRRAGRGLEVTGQDDVPPPANGSPGPDGLTEQEEIGRRIAEAVARLPEPQQEVFILRAYEDMDYHEIAASLGRPIGTVKSQMRLALGKMRVLLHDLGQAYGVA